MEVTFTKNDDLIIVRLKGYADFESTAQLQQTCKKSLMDKKVIFNLAELHFVGSSGVKTLVDTLQTLTSNAKIKMCNVKVEFQHIFASSHLGHLEIYENETSAKEAFLNSF